MAAPRSLRRLTVDAALARYSDWLELRVAEGKLRPRTLATYLRDLDDFVEIVGGDTVLDDLEPDDLTTALITYSRQPDRRYSRSAKRPRQPGEEPVGHGEASRARWQAAVRGLFAWAAHQQYIQLNPMVELSTIKVPRATGSRLGLEPGRAIALRDSPPVGGEERRRDQHLDLRDEFILRLLMETGPRVSELCAANLDDIDTDDDQSFLVIRDGKGGKRRRVPLSPVAVEVLRVYQTQERRSAPTSDAQQIRDDAARALVVTIRGRRMNPRDVQRMVERHVQALPPQLRRPVTPHGLRHTAATLLVHAGADVATVAHILGHESVATTSIYFDESDAAAAAAVRRSPITKS